MIRDEDRFAHMLEAIRLARESVEGLTKEQFLANPDKKAALQHYIMVVGEAANMVSDEIKAKYPGVPWREAVLDAGKKLWRYYHAQPKANPNASYYDIRKHFQGMKVTAKGKEQMNSMSEDERYNELLAGLKAAIKKLAAKIEPKVYEYGFLKR